MKTLLFLFRIDFSIFSCVNRFLSEILKMNHIKMMKCVPFLVVLMKYSLNCTVWQTRSPAWGIMNTPTSWESGQMLLAQSEPLSSESLLFSISTRLLFSGFFSSPDGEKMSVGQFNSRWSYLHILVGFYKHNQSWSFLNEQTRRVDCWNWWPKL